MATHETKFDLDSHVWFVTSDWKYPEEPQRCEHCGQNMSKLYLQWSIGRGIVVEVRVRRDGIEYCVETNDGQFEIVAEDEAFETRQEVIAEREKRNADVLMGKELGGEE